MIIIIIIIIIIMMMMMMMMMIIIIIIIITSSGSSSSSSSGIIIILIKRGPHEYVILGGGDLNMIRKTSPRFLSYPRGILRRRLANKTSIMNLETYIRRT
jgi:hypothetical protein